MLMTAIVAADCYVSMTVRFHRRKFGCDPDRGRKMLLTHNLQSRHRGEILVGQDRRRRARAGGRGRHGYRGTDSIRVSAGGCDLRDVPGVAAGSGLGCRRDNRESHRGRASRAAPCETRTCRRPDRNCFRARLPVRRGRAPRPCRLVTTAHRSAPAGSTRPIAAVSSRVPLPDTAASWPADRPLRRCWLASSRHAAAPAVAPAQLR